MKIKASAPGDIQRKTVHSVNRETKSRGKNKIQEKTIGT